MKIALMGSAPSSVNLAPFKDSRYHEWVQGKVQSVAQAHAEVPGDWDIWGCSPGCWAVIPRATRWFEVHRWQPGVPWFSPEYCEFLRRFKGPVYTGGVIPEIPNHVVYPIDRMEEKFGPYFFTSSLALMMALAIDEIETIRELREVRRSIPDGWSAHPAMLRLGTYPQPEELSKPEEADAIGLWGVDMAAQDEYCVAPETRVLTADLRWVSAETLEVGDELTAFDETGNGAGRRWRKASVQVAQRLMRPCWRLYMSDGTTLVASSEHRWLTYAEHENRWKQTDELVTNMHREGRPTRIVKLLDPWEEDGSWEAGYLAAAFDGEGHLVQIDRSECDGAQVILGFSQRENAMSEAVRVAAERMGFDLRAVGFGGKNGDCVKYRIAGGRSEVLKFLGRIRPRRLLAKFTPDILGVMHRLDAVAVERAEFLGEQPVIGLGTSTKTFVAEGFASHNSYQRPGCQFFILEALRRGIAVFLPPESDLLRPMPVYGISEWDHNYIKLTARARELNQSMQQYQQQLSEAQTKITQLAAAQAELSGFVNTWTSPYGLPAGKMLRHEPGTGLGSGVTHLDGRPMETKESILRAMANGPNTA